MDKFIIGFDLHDRFLDKRTVDAMFSFIKSFKPNIRILGGDIFDMTALRAGASVSDQGVSISDGIAIAEDFIKRFEPSVSLFGNHEDRIAATINNNIGPIKEYASIIYDEVHRIYEDVNCKTIDYNKRLYYQLGNYKVIHGFYAGLTAVKNHSISYGGNVIHGHTHSPGVYSVPSVNESIAISSPCLCNVDYEYNKKAPSSLSHKNGWVYGTMSRSGECSVRLAVKDEETNTFLCETSTREF
jgi:hypothetical protein